MMDSRQTNQAMISVIEKARGRSDSHPSSRLLSIALMAVFFIALMGGLAAGAQMYRSAALAQEQANELHLQSGLITNVIRYNDFARAVRQVAGPEGPALVLERTLSSGTYETRIYQYQGTVVQEFQAAGRPFDPAGATPLLKTNTFAFAINGNLITFTTDYGSFDVALRCDNPVAFRATDSQGGAA